MVVVITDTITSNDLGNYDMDALAFVVYGGINKWHYGRYVNKGVDTTVVEKVIIKSRKKPKRVVLDEEEFIQLGGPFEKIGDEDENVGGGNQKVG